MSNGNGRYTATDPHQVVDIRVEKGENAGEASRPALTVIEVFKSTVKKFGSRNAMALKRRPPVRPKLSNLASFFPANFLSFPVFLSPNLLGIFGRER